MTPALWILVSAVVLTIVPVALGSRQARNWTTGKRGVLVGFATLLALALLGIFIADLSGDDPIGSGGWISLIASLALAQVIVFLTVRNSDPDLSE